LATFQKCLDNQADYVDAILGLALVYYYKQDIGKAKVYINRAKQLKPVLNLDIEGFETFKKEGWFYSEKDNAALKRMLTKWK
jgi:hypothetical protein